MAKMLSLQKILRGIPSIERSKTHEYGSSGCIFLGPNFLSLSISLNSSASVLVIKTSETAPYLIFNPGILSGAGALNPVAYLGSHRNVNTTNGFPLLEKILYPPFLIYEGVEVWAIGSTDFAIKIMRL